MHMSVNSFRIAYGFFSNEQEKKTATTKILNGKIKTEWKWNVRMEKLVVVDFFLLFSYLYFYFASVHDHFISS